jgi:hypothetical protein
MLDINLHWERGTLQMERTNRKLIAVVGATGQQGDRHAHASPDLRHDLRSFQP